jgi:hypothetical protein
MELEPTKPTPEVAVAISHRFNLTIDWGGIDTATVYFNIEADDNSDDDESWMVSDDLQIFYKDIEITNLFDITAVEEMIYAQDKKVEQQIEDERLQDLIDYHCPYDND